MPTQDTLIKMLRIQFSLSKSKFFIKYFKIFGQFLYSIFRSITSYNDIIPAGIIIFLSPYICLILTLHSLGHTIKLPKKSPFIYAMQ